MSSGITLRKGNVLVSLKVNEKKIQNDMGPLQRATKNSPVQTLLGLFADSPFSRRVISGRRVDLGVVIIPGRVVVVCRGVSTIAAAVICAVVDGRC